MADKENEKRSRSEKFHLALALFWFSHIPFAAAGFFFMEFETYSRVALLYTVIVSALTIGLEHLIKRSTTKTERKRKEEEEGSDT